MIENESTNEVDVLLEEPIIEVYQADQYLSFYDLAQHPDFLPAWKNQDSKKIEQVLYEMGADLTHGYEMNVCQHRSRIDAKLINGPRYTFKERQDAEWLPFRSTEDNIRITGDKEFTKDLNQINKRYKLGNILDSMAEGKKRK